MESAALLAAFAVVWGASASLALAAIAWTYWALHDAVVTRLIRREQSRSSRR
jgi:hypothetical protein